MQEPQLFALAITLAYATIIFAILTLKLSQVLLVILLLSTNALVLTALLVVVFILRTLRKPYLRLTGNHFYLASDIDYAWGEPIDPPAEPDLPAEPEPQWPQAEQEVEQEAILEEPPAAVAYNWEAHWQPVRLATPPDTDSPSSEQAYLDLQEALGECLETIGAKVSEMLATLSARTKKDLEEYLKTRQSFSFFQDTCEETLLPKPDTTTSSPTPPPSANKSPSASY